RVYLEANLFAVLIDHGFKIGAFFFPTDNCSPLGLRLGSRLHRSRDIRTVDGLFLVFFFFRLCGHADCQGGARRCYCYYVFRFHFYFLTIGFSVLFETDCPSARKKTAKKVLSDEDFRPNPISEYTLPRRHRSIPRSWIEMHPARRKRLRSPQRTSFA